MDLLNGLLLGAACTEQAMINITTIVGYVVWGIKVAVPVILIIVGMVDLGTAVTKKSDDEVKKAQQSLIKKAVTAVIVFLVPTIVSLLMGILGSNDWKQCWTCIASPSKCGVKVDLDENGNTEEENKKNENGEQTPQP